MKKISGLFKDSHRQFKDYSRKMEFKDYSMTSPKIQRLSKTVQTLFDELFGKDGPP